MNLLKTLDGTAQDQIVFRENMEEIERIFNNLKKEIDNIMACIGDLHIRISHIESLDDKNG